MKIYWSPASVTYNKPRWFVRWKQHTCRLCLLCVWSYEVVYKWLNDKGSVWSLKRSSEALEWLQPPLRCHQLPQNNCRGVRKAQLCMNLGAFTVACHLIQEERGKNRSCPSADGLVEYLLVFWDIDAPPRAIPTIRVLPSLGAGCRKE